MWIKRLVLTKEQLKELVAHAKEQWPLESVALLFGEKIGEKAVSEYVVPAENVSASRISFSVDPDFLLEAYTKAESIGRELVGISHSHPAPPLPSTTDLDYMKLNPVPWLIISMPSSEYSAHMIHGNKVIRIEVEVLG